MDLWILWLAVGGVLLISEIAFQWVWTLCLAIGCIVAMIGALCDASLLMQVVYMSASAVVAYILLIPVLNKWQENARNKNKSMRTGMDALLGRVAVVTDEIRPGRLGRARIDGDYWQVRLPGATEVVRRGEEVVVTGYDSIILDVELRR